MQKKRSDYEMAALVGALATAGLIGWLYVGHQLVYALPFVPFDITDFIIRLTPGAVATTGIERLGHWARVILRWLGVLVMIGFGAGLGAGAAALRARLNGWMNAAILAAASMAAAAFIVTLAIQAAVRGGLASEPVGLGGLAVSYAAWAAAIVWATGRVGQRTGADSAQAAASPARRRFLAGFGVAMIGLAAGGYLLGRRLRPTAELAALPELPATPPAGAVLPAADAAPAPAPTRSPIATPQASPTPPALAQATLAPPSLTPGAPLPDFIPARRTRPNITPLADFFAVNIGAEEPRIELARWRLEVKGLVEQPLTLTFDDLLALPRVDIHGTLACISNEVGGRLIGTTLFSGARLGDVLQMARPQRGVAEVVMRAVDRYSESMPFDKALHEDTLLVYGMDGKLLTPEHGYPLRIFNPNHYGMKGPKWLASLELVAEPYDGYWPRMGWDKEATVKSTSVIDGAGDVRAENGLAQLGGIAFAGWRGIQEVAIQIDGGEFRPAVNLDRPLSPLTWVRWRYDWRNPPAGDHTIVVRAIDGNGEEQSPQPAPPHPDGASGWHKVHVLI
jgi:DMSO/TMAO reductase YedYZ molybdopterin-dependent catalytic subunit